MKTSFWWHPIYVAVIIAILLVKCDGNYSDEITVPEVKGIVESKKPLKHTPIERPHAERMQNSRSNNPTSANNAQVQNNNVPSLLEVLEWSKTDSINQSIFAHYDAQIEAYKAENDSLKREQMFAAALLPQDVTETLEDSIIKINMLAKVSGYMHNVKLSYTRKEFKTKAPKQYSLLGGLNLTSNVQLSKIGVIPNVSYQSPNKTLYSFGKDLMCSDCFMVGAQKNIFTFSRKSK